MDTRRFSVDSQVDKGARREVRVCSFCLPSLIQLCQVTTTPNCLAKKIILMLVSLPLLRMEKVVVLVIGLRRTSSDGW